MEGFEPKGENPTPSAYRFLNNSVKMANVKEIIYAIEDYKANIKSVLIFTIPFLISLLISIGFSHLTFLAIGGEFLRIGNIPFISLFELAMLFISVGIALYLIAFAFTGISLVVKEGRISKIRNVLFEEIFWHRLNKVFLFQYFIFLLIFLIQLLIYVLSLPSFIFLILSFFITYIFFFVPYAIVIDDYDLSVAIHKSLVFLIKQPLLPLIWAIIGSLMIVVFAILFMTFFDYSIARYLVLLINAFFIAPFLIVYGAHLYLRKYPMTLEVFR